jgi:nucleotide-binding universal stress UspA family protein
MCGRGAKFIMSNNMKLLIAYDGSAYADAAIEDLRRAGLPETAEAVVISVSDAWELPEIVDRATPESGKPSRENADVIKRHLQQVIENSSVMAEGAAARVREKCPGWDVRAEAFAGKPAWEIIKFADDWGPDLIVVGSHGRGFMGRALLGSVSQKVLHESRNSVRIARERTKGADAPLSILVAVDGSENSDLCIDTVVARKWPEETEFRIITADDDPRSRPETSILDAVPEGHTDSPEAKEWVDRVIRKPAKKMKDAGFNVSQFCRWGDARRVILEEADEWQADCIFIGARGLSRFKRLLIGSVSAAVAAKAKCSVEVVRISK